MNPRTLTAALLAAALAAVFGPSGVRADVGAPAGRLIEAEAHAASDSRVAADAGASGGRVVGNDKDWQPLVGIPVADLGGGDGPVTLAVRHVGGPLLVKAVVDGEQREVGQVWATPDALAWSKAGPFDRASLGTEVVLVRGGGGGTVSIDAVVVEGAAEDSPATAGAGKADAEVGAPGDTVVEAEASPPGGSGKVVNDAAASGGRAVQSDGAYQPVFRSDALAGLSGRVTVWARYKGGPVQLKTVAGGGQTERDWSWATPEDFAWHRLGTYDAADLGESILIIRGESAGPTAVDAVCYSVADAGADAGAAPNKPRVAEVPQGAGDAGITGAAASGASALPPERHDPSVAAVDADLSIDWDAAAGTLGRDLWGVSLFRLVKPAESADPAYAAWLAELRPSFVRIHSAEMTGLWWDDEADAWDVEAIRACFAPHRGWLDSGGVKVMLCAPYDWPASVRGEAENGKYLPPDRYDAGMEHLRQLVSIVVDDLGVPVTHWELTNEWDNAYEQAGKIDELWPLVGRMAGVVRSAAPGVEVGGPALTWPKPAWVDGFLDGAGADVAFVSWHGYGTGEPTTPNDALFARAPALAEHAADVRRAMESRGLGGLGTYLTEFNVQWTWRPYERRHANSVGAAFLASVIGDAARAGLDGAAMWHAMGDAYGLVDSAGRRRATGQLYLWANRYAHGRLAAATVSGLSPAEGTAGLVALPVALDGGGRTVLLANQTAGTVRLGRSAADLLGSPDSASPDPASLRVLRVTADGASVESPSPGEPLDVPGYSVAFVTTAAGDEPVGEVPLPGQGVRFGF